MIPYSMTWPAPSVGRASDRINGRYSLTKNPSLYQYPMSVRERDTEPQFRETNRTRRACASAMVHRSRRERRITE